MAQFRHRESIVLPLLDVYVALLLVVPFFFIYPIFIHFTPFLPILPHFPPFPPISPHFPPFFHFPHFSEPTQLVSQFGRGSLTVFPNIRLP